MPCFIAGRHGASQYLVLPSERDDRQDKTTVATAA